VNDGRWIYGYLNGYTGRRKKRGGQWKSQDDMLPVSVPGQFNALLYWWKDKGTTDVGYMDI
jgi:hypothetical protein